MIETLIPLTNHHNRHKTGVIQFYFDATLDKQRQKIDNFLRSLIKQSIYQLENIPDSIVNTYDRVSNDGKSAEPNTSALTALLNDCFHSFSTIFVVIDALDECDKWEMIKIVRELQQLPKSNLRLFVTGRPHVLNYRHYDKNDPIHEWLKGATTQEIIAAKTDIEKYVRERYKTEAIGSDEISEQLRDGITKLILSQPEGPY